MSQISRAAPSLARPRGLSPFLPAIPAVLLHPWRGIRAAVSSLPLTSVPAGTSARPVQSDQRSTHRMLRLRAVLDPMDGGLGHAARTHARYRVSDRLLGHAGRDEFFD